MIKSINFSSENSCIYDINTNESPSKFIDIAKQLERIMIPEIQTSEFYLELNRLLDNCNDSIKMKTVILGGYELSPQEFKSRRKNNKKCVI